MKKTVVLNFTPHLLSKTATEQLNNPNVLQCPVSVTPNMDLTRYIDGLLDSIDIVVNEETIYMLVLPGLSILAGMICRNLSERQIPYQIVNLIRSSSNPEFVVQGIY